MSNSVIGALRANLSLDSARFERGANRARGSAQNLRRSILAISGAIAAVGAGMAAAIRGQLSAIDDLGKAADRIGVPVEDLSRLQHAADLSAVSMGNLEASLQRLAREMVENEEKFSDMGISVRDAEGNMRPITEVLADIAEVMQSLPQGAERTALAYELMGRQGAALIPMLENGAAGLRAMTDEADRLGLTITEETAVAAANFNDNLSRMAAAVTGLWRVITAQLAPVLVAITEKIVAVADGFQRLPGWVQRTAVVVTGLTAALAPLAAGIALMTAGFGALAAPILVVIGALGAGVGLWALLQERLDPLPELMERVTDAQAALNSALGTFAETGAPQAGAQSQAYARRLEEQARAALAAAEAELALAEAHLESRTVRGGAAGAMAGVMDPAGRQQALAEMQESQERVEELRATLDGARRTLDALGRQAIAAGASSGEFSDIVATVNVETGDLADTLDDLNSGLGRVPANAEAGATALEKTKEAARQAQGEVATLAQGLGRFLTQVASGADAARQAIANLLSRAAEMLLNQGLMNLLGGMNLSGGFGSILSGLFGGGLGGSSASLTASAASAMPSLASSAAAASGSGIQRLQVTTGFDETMRGFTSTIRDETGAMIAQSFQAIDESFNDRLRAAVRDPRLG